MGTVLFHLADHTCLNMKAVLLLLLPLLCSASPHLEDRGFFDFDNLWNSGNPIDTLLGLLNSDNNTDIEETTTDTQEEGGSIKAIKAITDVLTGVTNVLPLDLIKQLLGLTSVPSPLVDPVGFLKHPLVVPILMSAITFNPPAMAVAMGALAGNMALMSLFEMAG